MVLVTKSLNAYYKHVDQREQHAGKAVDTNYDDCEPEELKSFLKELKSEQESTPCGR